jgi:F-type H+-transporting ATPase subunit a
VHELEPPVFHTFGIPHHVAFGWLVMAILIVVAYLIPRRPALVPRGVQNAAEAVLEFVLALIDDVIGARAGGSCRSSRPSGSSSSPRTSWAGARVHGADRQRQHEPGVRPRGVLLVPLDRDPRARAGGLLKHFAGPMPALAPLMVPIELISHLARPLSLTLRLFGNMLAATSCSPSCSS